MSEPLKIIPATRQGIKPLIGLYGKSGGGKTRTALLLARGIVGPAGRIALIDTENKRGHIFADVIPGSYQVIDLDAPFSPERYTAALELAEQSADIVIFDSMTHEWDGEGGVLEMQEAEVGRMTKGKEERRDAVKMAAWIMPKFEHKKFVQRLLRSKLPIICCLRSQEKTRMSRGDDGKMKVITDEFTTPIYDSKFIFEMLICAEVYAIGGKGGYLHITKITHENLFSCLPDEKTQAYITHGEKIRAWCDNAGANPLHALKAELWKATKAINLGKAENKQALEVWLVKENIITDSQTLDSLTKEELPAIIAKAKEALTQPQPQ